MATRITKTPATPKTTADETAQEAMERWFQKQDLAVERVATRLKRNQPPSATEEKAPDQIEVRDRLRVRHSKLVCRLRTIEEIINQWDEPV